MVLQAYRNPAPNGPWMCCADTVPGDCPNTAVMQWARCAPGNTDASQTVPVMACADHQLTADLMAQIHQSTCAAPPVCDCIPFTPASPEIVRAGG